VSDVIHGFERLDPYLECLSIDAVLQAGERHGVPRGDLYGCLYFYLQEQLHAFAERLSCFKATFHVFCMDAQKLAQEIHDGTLAHVVPPTTTFDRIEVSNIFDTEYVGIPGVIESWGPFLKVSGDAAIVGFFMNWAPKQPGAVAKNCEKDVVSRLTSSMIKDGRVCPHVRLFCPPRMNVLADATSFDERPFPKRDGRYSSSSSSSLSVG
jgi:hypothetical protein